MEEILIVESNLAGNGARAISLLRALGFVGHFVTRNPADYEFAVLNPLTVADKVSVCNPQDIGHLLRLACQNSIRGIVAFDDFHVIPAAAASCILGLREFRDMKGFLNTRYKDRTRAILNETEMKIAHAVLQKEHVFEACPLPFPCIVKPVDESGSTGVHLVNDDAGFRCACEMIRRHSDASAPLSLVGSVLIEEWIAGNEYSAECVHDTEHDDWILIGFTRKFVKPGTHFVEIGHVFPHSFGSTFDAQIQKTLFVCLNKLGIRATAVHIEFKIRSGLPVVLEVNPRPAGGMIPSLIRLAIGVDIIDLHLRSILGLGFEQHLTSSWCKFAAVWFVVSEHGGTITKITDTSEHSENVCDFFLQPVGTIVSGLGNAGDRLGFAIAVGSCQEIALERAKARVRDVSLEVRFDSSIPKSA